MKRLLIIIAGLVLAGCSYDHDDFSRICPPDGDYFWDHVKKKFKGSEQCAAWKAVEQYRTCAVDQKANEFIDDYRRAEYCIALKAVRVVMDSKSLEVKEQYGRHWVHPKPKVVYRKPRRSDDDDDTCRSYGCRSSVDQVMNGFSPVKIF